MDLTYCLVCFQAFLNTEAECLVMKYITRPEAVFLAAFKLFFCCDNTCSELKIMWLWLQDHKCALLVIVIAAQQFSMHPVQLRILSSWSLLF